MPFKMALNPPVVGDIDISLSFKMIMIFVFAITKLFKASKQSPLAIPPSPTSAITLYFSCSKSRTLAKPKAALKLVDE